MSIAHLTISLSAIAENWKALSTIAQGAECSAVVKANAYGCGMGRVAPALTKAGCKTFFVAHLQEGIELRALLHEATIYIFNGLPKNSIPEYEKHNLRPVLGSVEEVKEWIEYKSTLPFALHVDTGMNRLGVRVDELSALPECQPALLMSHFVSSEEPNSELNQKQIEAFKIAREKYTDVRASLANSSGIFLKDKPFYNMVRPGYALYGGNATPTLSNLMRNVVTLYAPIVQISNVRKGEGVGYNAQWIAKRDSRIATLSLGYADGILRSGFHEHGLQVYYDGKLCPVAGRISMDLITIDVTDSEKPPQRGDMIEVIGPHITIDDIAKSLKTNGYEVLTSLGARYKRDYI